MSAISTFLSIVVAVIVFGLLIFIHELGHFTAAKLSGVRVNEFAVGMGPALLKKDYKGTRYALRVFPIGGYCSMEGEDQDSGDPHAFGNAKLWRRIVIVCAGAVMNIVLGFLLALVLMSASPIHNPVVSQFVKGAASDKGASPLKTGDRILAINGSRVHTVTDITYDLMLSDSKTIPVTVERDGKTVYLPAVQFPLITSGGVTAMVSDFEPQLQHKTMLSVMRSSFYYTVATVKLVWMTLYLMIRGRYSVQDMSGPVGVSAAMGEAASAGAIPLLFITILITVNLGVVNLLPLPALDGGRLVFLLLEGVRGGKRVKPEVEGYIHFAGFVLLILLVVLVTFSDISKIAGGFFR